jgi:mRNA interferase MazF
VNYQWSVFVADLEPVVGREQGLRRPVLVISAEPLNEAYDVVTVVPLTSRKDDRPARLGEVLLPAGEGGLKQESFALCYQVRAIDKSRLTDIWGIVSAPELRRAIRDAVTLCLDLYE